MKRRAKIMIVSTAVFLPLLILSVLFYNGIIWPVNPATMGYEVAGIDVSHYQGDIDWRKIAEQNYQFSFMKATEGSSYVDPYYVQNIQAASENDIKCGAYHFFSAESGGQTQAANFINTTSGQALDLPPVLDFEIPKTQGDTDAVIKEAIIFLEEVEAFYGVTPIIYTTYESYKAYLSQGFEAYPLWFRSLLHEPQAQDFVFWQYNNRGRVDGIDPAQKYTDLNVYNGSQASFDAYIEETRNAYSK